jgi:hypothetical protein
MRFLYHPNEIRLDGSSQACRELCECLMPLIPETLRVAMVRHGVPEQDMTVPVLWNLALAGTRTQWDLPTHPDPATLSVLLQGFDLALLEHPGATQGPCIKLLDDAPQGQVLDGALALYGKQPPERTPAGGIPFFRNGEELELLQWVVEEACRARREEPLLGLVAGVRVGQDLESRLEMLRDVCAQVFVVVEPSQSAGIPSWVQTIPRTLGGVDYVGDLLCAAQSVPGANWMVVSGRENEDSHPARLAGLLDARDPLSDATAWAGYEKSLPMNDSVIWEAKGIGRLWSFLGAGLRCPQRILNQCRVRLLEP